VQGPRAENLPRLFDAFQPFIARKPRNGRIAPQGIKGLDIVLVEFTKNQPLGFEDRSAGHPSPRCPGSIIELTLQAVRQRDYVGSTDDGPARGASANRMG